MNSSQVVLIVAVLALVFICFKVLGRRSEKGRDQSVPVRQEWKTPPQRETPRAPKKPEASAAASEPKSTVTFDSEDYRPATKAQTKAIKRMGLEVDDLDFAKAHYILNIRGVVRFMAGRLANKVVYEEDITKICFTILSDQDLASWCNAERTEKLLYNEKLPTGAERNEIERMVKSVAV